MSSPREAYDRRQTELIDESASFDVQSEEFREAAKNLRLFSESGPLIAHPESEPTLVPTTRWGKIKAGMSAVWDNETTRVFLKAGGAFAGVGLVVWSTVHRDHVMEKQAMQQANQRPV